jgi:DNA polymerase III subunit epsilon
MSLRKDKFAIIDIETTGGSYRYDKITEIAIIVYQNGEIIDQFESLVNPTRSIPTEITRITGITNEMVENAPQFYEIAKDIVQKTDGCIFVAHNVHFDYSFIREEFLQLGFSFIRKKLCTVQLSRKYIKGLKSYSLGNLIKHFNIEVQNRHRAMDDTQATLQVFKYILNATKLVDAGIQPIHHLLKESKIPAHLDADKIQKIPEDCGVYYMKDLNVYIGKSKNIHARLLQHFNETSTKNQKMMMQVSEVDYLLSGNELMALLIEARDIKIYQPEINRALRQKKFSHSIIFKTHSSGFLQYQVKGNDWLREEDVVIQSFPSSIAARQFLNYLTEKYQLCSSINHLKDNNIKPCHLYQLGLCLGACSAKESIEDYNIRFMAMHDHENKLFKSDFIIIDKGRHIRENSAIVIKDAYCSHIGFLDQESNYNNWDDIIDSLESYPSSIESNRIIHQYLSKNKKLKILNRPVDR